MPHHECVIESLRPLLAKTKPPKFFLIGDFNISQANWTLGSSSVSAEQSFMDSYRELFVEIQDKFT